MTEKKNDNVAMGPQGTQVFELDEVNKMIAAEITDAQPANATTPALVGVSRNVTGQKFILSKKKMEVGRRPTSDIVLQESSVSAMHAQIIYQEGSWKVLNLLSSNGTFVNGSKVSEMPIVPGDRVAFAGSEFVFTLVEDQLQAKKSNKNFALLLMLVVLLAGFGSVLYFIL